MKAWESITGPELRQGDMLRDCQIPIFGEDFGKATADEENDVGLSASDLIILSQSCDLAVRKDGRPKAKLVALCPIHSLTAFQTQNELFRQSKICEQVRRGQFEGIHMLPSLSEPFEKDQVFLASFREIVSLPFAYLVAHAEALGQRSRLASPYVEHFSQGFARFFMRVGLPLDIPSFLEK